MYGSCSWADPKHVLEKLDTTHRRHLRSILNIIWPHVIPNVNLYKRCDVVPKSRRGRHQINLVNTIKSDLNLRGFTLNCLEDLFSIRDVASDKKRWNSLFVVE